MSCHALPLEMKLPFIISGVKRQFVSSSGRHHDAPFQRLLKRDHLKDSRFHVSSSSIGDGMGQLDQVNSRSAAPTVLVVVGAGTAPGGDCKTITGQTSA